MKKLVLLATALAMVSGSALAADMRVKAVKAPPPVAFDPWDIAFGAGIASDYVFRGITQSNHKASVSAYFEPRYNVTKDVQLYVGLAGASISFPNRAAAEIDIYGGIRPTIGMFAFDFGVWGYLYPGGQCLRLAVHPGTGQLRRRHRLLAGRDRPSDQRQLRQEARQLLRRLCQGQRNPQRHVRDRRQRILLAELHEHGCLGQLRLDHRQVHRAELDLRLQRPRHVRLRRVRPAVARNLRRRSTASPATRSTRGGIKEPSYNTWNIGVGFTYKVFTLDIRYSDTNLSKGDCNAFTSDFSTTNSSPSFVTPINGGANAATAFGSGWCGATGIVKLSADLTAMTSLK